MGPRIDYYKLSPEGYKAMLGLEHYLNNSSVEKKLLHLLKLRVSQTTAAPFAWTCIGRTCKWKAKTNSACTRWTHGARHPITLSANELRWPGRKRSPTYGRDMCRTPYMRRRAGTSVNRK
jgi:hypothetical protein